MECLIKVSFFINGSFSILDSISSCSIGEECISIKTCSPIIEQLTRAKETSDVVKKRSIISQVREKVCGERSERLICCPQEGSKSSGRQGTKDIFNLGRKIMFPSCFSKNWILQEHLPRHWWWSLCSGLANNIDQRIYLWWRGPWCLLPCRHLGETITS